jgi:hypothetical protein
MAFLNNWEPSEKTAKYTIQNPYICKMVHKNV